MSSIADLTLQLINIPSVSGNEAAVESFIREQMSGYDIAYDEDTVLCFANARRSGVPLVVLAGHTDTVPIDNNVPGRLEDGIVHGRGASDMKGGLAVMLQLAELLRSTPCVDIDFGFLFFGREELAASENPLPKTLAESELLRSADLAILMEPTSNALEAGCQGNLNLTLTFQGRAGHSARPWTGVNAAHQAILGLHELAALQPNDVNIDGLVFREVASVTGIRGGVARNVIPASTEVDINIRYAPTRTALDAEAMWYQRAEEWGADVEVIGNAGPAPVVTKHPLAQRLLAAGAGAPMPKQAWTNTADFAAVGVPAINFGPGDPALAHTADEHVSVEALEASLTVLRLFAQPSA